MRLTIRNFSTLFLLAAVVIGPLHIAFAFWFRSVLGLGDVDLTRAVEVGALNAGEFAWMQRAAAAVLVAELLLVFVLQRGAARVIERDTAGDLPTTWDAVRALGRSSHRVPVVEGNPWPAAIASVGIALLGGSTVAVVGQIVLDLLPGSLRFVGIAALQTSARAAAMTFLITFLALIGARAKASGGAEPTS